MDDSLKNQVLLQGSKYKIVRVFGQGGFGITYEGVQTGLSQKVADLQHTNIVNIFDVFEENNTAYLVFVPSALKS